MDHAPLVRHESAERHLHIDTMLAVEEKDNVERTTTTTTTTSTDRSTLLRQAQAAVRERKNNILRRSQRRSCQFDQAVEVLHQSVDSRLNEMVSKGESQEVVRLYAFSWTIDTSTVDEFMLDDKEVWREMVSRYYGDPGRTTARVMMIGDGAKVLLSVEHESVVKRWFNGACVNYHGGLHAEWRWVQLCCC